MRQPTHLRDISVYAPDEVRPGELEILGPYVPATHKHLLMARGWEFHEPCLGTGILGREVESMCTCAFGLVPSEREVEMLSDFLDVHWDMVLDALVEIERIRMANAEAERHGAEIRGTQEERYGMDVDSPDGIGGGGISPPLRSVDAEEGSVPDQTLDDDDD